MLGVALTDLSNASAWRRFFQMLGVALTDFTRSNTHYVAAGVAYWTLFSLFPLALASMSILGFFYDTPEDRSRIVQGIVDLVPVSEDYLGGLVDDVTRARGALGVLAILALVWTGTAVFSAVRKSINHAWHIREPHYFLHERAIDFAMLLGVAALAFVQVVFTTNLLGIAGLTQTVTESGDLVAVRVTIELLGLVFTFGVFLVLYRYTPNTKVLWRDLWLGAIMGATLFHGVKLGFAWYLSNFGSLNLVYGSLGAIMAVLLWAYLSAIAIAFGRPGCLYIQRGHGLRGRRDRIAGPTAQRGRFERRRGPPERCCNRNRLAAPSPKGPLK